MNDNSEDIETNPAPKPVIPATNPPIADQPLPAEAIKVKPDRSPPIEPERFIGVEEKAIPLREGEQAVQEQPRTPSEALPKVRLMTSTQRMLKETGEKVRESLNKDNGKFDKSVQKVCDILERQKAEIETLTRNAFMMSVAMNPAEIERIRNLALSLRDSRDLAALCDFQGMLDEGPTK